MSSGYNLPPRKTTLVTPQINNPIDLVNRQFDIKQMYDRIATERGFQKKFFTAEIEELRTYALSFLRGENDDSLGQDVVLTSLLIHSLGFLINENFPLFFRPSTGSEEYSKDVGPSEVALFGSPTEPFTSVVGKIHFSSAEHVSSGYLQKRQGDTTPFLLIAKDLHGVGFHDLPTILQQPHPLKEFNNRIAPHEGKIVNILGPIITKANQLGY